MTRQEISKILHQEDGVLQTVTFPHQKFDRVGLVATKALSFNKFEDIIGVFEKSQKKSV